MSIDPIPTFAKVVVDRIADLQIDLAGLCEYKLCIAIVEAALRQAQQAQLERDAQLAEAFEAEMECANDCGERIAALLRSSEMAK